MAACKKHRAKLVIAKLDRLARDVAFIATLMNGKVDFVCVDFPTANRLTLHILAAVAEHEAKMISERTKAGLGVIRERIKANGSHVSKSGRTITALGNTVNLAEAQKRGAETRMKQADQFAKNVLPIIRDIESSGVRGLRGIAKALTARGVPTARGGQWSPQHVSLVLQRSGQ